MKKVILVVVMFAFIFGVCFAESKIIYPEPIIIHMGQDTLLYDEGYSVYRLFKEDILTSPGELFNNSPYNCPYIAEDSHGEKLMKYLFSMERYTHAYSDYYEFDPVDDEKKVTDENLIAYITGCFSIEHLDAIPFPQTPIIYWDKELNIAKAGERATMSEIYISGTLTYHWGRFIRGFSWLGDYETLFSVFGYSKISLYDFCGSPASSECVDYHNNTLIYNPNYIWAATADIALKPYIDSINLQHNEEYGRDRIYVGKYIDFIPEFVLP